MQPAQYRALLQISFDSDACEDGLERRLLGSLFQALARRAQSGDKQAQLELGIREEEGRGVPMDSELAERLYRMAATDSGGTAYVYLPPVGKHGRGRVAAISRGSARWGLADARVRLERLRSRAAREGR
jgi:hypothetical protein